MIPSRAILLVFVVAAGACEPSDPYDALRTWSSPLQTNASLVWLSQTDDETTDVHNELLFATPQDNNLSVARVALGDGQQRALWAKPSVDGSSVLCLLGPSSESFEDVDEQLVVVPESGFGEPRTYDVLAPFTALARTPNGERAVLHFDGTEQTSSLQNANLVAVVPITRTAKPKVLTLRGFGGQVRAVEFPAQRDLSEVGTLDIGGSPRDLAVFLAADELVLLDMNDPENGQVAVQFGEDVAFEPVATLLRAGDALFEAPVLFVRSRSGQDVAMLSLVAKADGDGFTAQVSLVPVGAPADSFLSFNSEDAPYIVTASSSRDTLAFTDIRTQQTFEITLGAAVSQLKLRTHVTDLGTTVPQVVAWREGDSAIYTLTLDNIDSVLGRTASELRIPGGIGSIEQLDNDHLLIAASTELYVVDLQIEQVTPLSSPVAYEPSQAVLEANHLLLGAIGQRNLNIIDLQTLNPQTVALDADIASFHYLPTHQKLVAVHHDNAGYLTVASTPTPKRSTSFSAWGFLYHNVLDP